MTVPTDALLGCSRRHLSSTVRTEFEVTPKECRRLVRFESARGRLVAGARAGEVGERPVAHGAEVVVPIENRPYGKRSGRIRDPFGHLWIITGALR